MICGVTMKRKTEHYPIYSTEPAVTSSSEGELGGRDHLRQILSRLGLHANTAQENLLLELIHRSNCQQNINC